MKLALKFNLILISILLIGFIISGISSYMILQNNAKQEILDRAKIMMEAAVAMRDYTVKEVRPLLKVQNKRNFLPQTVPAYAATQTFDRLRQKYPEYTYKEATLNPTNPRDRAIDWEHDIIQRFTNDSALTSLTGKRDTLSGESLYLANPIRIKNPACLSCHSTVAAAPASMIKLYGTANGFGWKLDEVIGAQIVTVPMELSIQQAHHAFVMFMSILAGVFVFIVIVANILLRLLVIKPIIEMADIANRMSQGEEDLPEFEEKGKSEIAVLGASFNRMKRSLEKAMDMLGS